MWLCLLGLAGGILHDNTALHFRLIEDAHQQCFCQQGAHLSELFGAVESLIDLPVLLEQLRETPEEDADTHPASKLLEEAFTTPEVLVASFGKVKHGFCPVCHALQQAQAGEHSASSKDHSLQVVQSTGFLQCLLTWWKASATQCLIDCILVLNSVEWQGII